MKQIIKTCDTCKWWDNSFSSHLYGDCNNSKVFCGSPKLNPDEAFTVEEGHSSLITGPKFGCVKHEDS